MSLISKEIEINLTARNINHYENLGYKIPRYKDSQGRFSVKKGTKIIVKVNDLSKGSHVKIKVKCDLCGKEYDIVYKDYIRYVDKNGIITCLKCVKEETREKQRNTKIGKYTRENNPNWNPNLTDEERESDRNLTDGYNCFVSRVLKRDNYTCQCCNKKSDKCMVVHHLDGYNWCKEKRTDETNGITLCKNCHENFHSIYGRGNNTKEQFEEWIGHAVDLLKFCGELSPTRKIYCIEENKIYDSAIILQKKLNLKSKANIYRVCNHSPHKNTVRGYHIMWYDEYLKTTNQEPVY